MALKDLLKVQEERINQDLTEERIRAIMPVVRQYIAFWREYPDLFVDFMQEGWTDGKETREKPVKLFFYQRIIMRCCVRYRQVFIVIPRGASKSFLNVLVQIVRCILFPGVQLFISAEGKEQGASILASKVEEICNKIPAFKNEINWERGGGTVIGKDRCIYKFKNGSQLDNLAATEKTRGQRRHGGTFEEAVLFEGKILQEVLIPVMNIARQCLDGTVQMDESPNMSQIFLTTAGSRSSYCYKKLITFLVRMITEPSKAIVLGGSYKIPMAVGLFNPDFIKDQQRDGTFNEAAFLREYGSHWTGSSDGAFFDSEAFVHNRQLAQAEYEAQRETPSSYYILGVDIGRRNCPSVVIPIKVLPQANGTSKKSIVNIYNLNRMHFEEQAIFIKRLFYKYKAKAIAIDANGMGHGVVDYMVKSQTDNITGDFFPDFGVINDKDNDYKRFQTADTVLNALYLIKADAPFNTEAHVNLQQELNSGRLKFLVNEQEARQKLLTTQRGQKMRPEERDEYLLPYVSTSLLQSELENLVEEHEGVNIILKPAIKTVKHDRVSALEYGLLYIKREEESKKKKKFKVSDFIFMTKG